MNSLIGQKRLVDQVIIVDASDIHEEVHNGVNSYHQRFPGLVTLIKAGTRGAAAQRNLGMSVARGEYVLFLDDDIDFIGDNCIGDLIAFLENTPGYAGASVLIKNQFPVKMGRTTKFVLGLVEATKSRSKDYGGSLVGPALNFLPTLHSFKTSVLEVQWLNTTCTLYRKDCLPTPTFDSVFTGYSLMEDVTLSVRVAKKGRLAILRDAVIYHDTQPGDHKANPRDLAKMALVNRDYVARRIIGCRGIFYWWGLSVWEVFQVFSALKSPQQRLSFKSVLTGKLAALWHIIRV
jgi:GT2 family glycosyltransferase